MLLFHGQSVIEHIFPSLVLILVFTIVSNEIKNFMPTTSVLLFFLSVGERHKGKVPTLGSMNPALLHRWL